MKPQTEITVMVGGQCQLPPPLIDYYTAMQSCINIAKYTVHKFIILKQRSRSMVGPNVTKI